MTGRSLVHLQCQFGLGTLSWARRGAQVTGLDFSPVAIAAATETAARAGLQARFVVADVYDAVAALGGGTFDVVYTGFHEGPRVWDEPGTYADLAAETHSNRTHEWTHGLGDVVSSVISAGLVVEHLHEFDYTLFPRWPFLVHDPASGAYCMPDDRPSLPLMYSLRARKPPR